MVPHYSGTIGNDALFLQNFATTGNALYQEETGTIFSSPRILGVENFHLSDGDNFLDFTSTNTSLSGLDFVTTFGSGNDIFWSSDANETISLGNGNDQLILNGGTDNVTTGLGNDIITITNSVGTSHLLDFNTEQDVFIFYTSADNLTIEQDKVIVQNILGQYTLTFPDNTDLTDINNISTFL